MSVQEVLDELKSLGSESTKKVLEKHGAREPFFGVKVEDLKKIQRRIKKDYKLALELYDTGISDAMYLAGLIADDAKMTTKDLQRWAKEAYWSMLSEYTVPWVAAESRHGHELALEWIDSPKENIAAAGWATLSSLVAIKDDAELDLAELKRLLDRVSKTIHGQPGRVPLVMNGYVIAVGTYVKALTDAAIETAQRIGKVSVDLGDTSCKVPSAVDYIQKAQQRGSVGKKRKTTRC
jgi:3-methyladenine DNA glycosylase AlkD